MNIFQSLINSQLGVGLAFFLGRIVPPRVGHRLSIWAADLVSMQKRLPIVQAVRANQWVLTGEKLTTADLDRQVRSVFRHNARSLYDLYHVIDRPETAKERVQFTPAFTRVIAAQKENRRGIFFVSAHTGNFDLAFRGIIQKGVKAQILSYPEPPGGYRMQNEMRLKAGMEVTPLSISALRLAGERLKAGGNVVTGIDRPIDDEKYPVRFFGRKASLPVTHIRLALKTGAPVVVLANQVLPDGTILVDSSDPIELNPHPDLATELVQNAEKVLSVLENFICKAPQQWLMFYPVWPQALQEMPR